MRQTAILQRKSLILTVSLTILLLMIISSGRASSLVVPSTFSRVFGTYLPFRVQQQRTQQIYSSSEFSSLGGALSITEFRFRPHWSQGHSFNETLEDVQINMSTTARTPATMSPTFADNIGTNDTVVFDGPITLSSSDIGPPRGPKEFDISVPLQTPFLYYPSVGDLLVDYRVFSGSMAIGQNDGVQDSPFASRVYNSDVDATGSASGLVGTGTAPVTQFIYDVLPEPPRFCNFDGLNGCRVPDLNLMFGQGDLTDGVPTPPGNAYFDMNKDKVIDNQDIDDWLLAATINDRFATNYRRGDTELDRDIDITDFNRLAAFFDATGDGDPKNGPGWNFGNFDGDDDIDITDFNFLASNFAPDGYGASAVPEPSIGIMLLLGIIGAAGSLRIRA